MKATKKQLRSALDAFLWTHADLTGGTREEVRNQAAHGITRLRKLADECQALAANPNKAAAADDHLMEYCTEIVPRKLASYEARYGQPSNIVNFLYQLT